jgi:hypothetical protein
MFAALTISLLVTLTVAGAILITAFLDVALAGPKKTCDGDAAVTPGSRSSHNPRENAAA